MRMLRSGVAVLLLALVVPALGQEERIDMRPGFTQILRINRPYSNAIIGDPSMVDVLPADDKNIILTAKKVGQTNIVVLDAQNREMFTGNIVVTTRETGRVQIHGRAGGQGATTSISRTQIGGLSNTTATSSPGSAQSVHEYITYECSPTGCRRTSDEFERESTRQRDIFVPEESGSGVRRPPQ